MEKFPKENSKTERDPEEEYRGLLTDYSEKFKELKKLERQAPPGASDEELRRHILFVDQERNEIHKKLKKSGEEFGKDASDILADILRKQGNLAEYGLPEFSIMTDEDFDPNSDNISDDLSTADPEFYEESRLAALDSSKVLIVFAVYMAEEDPPEDLETRRKKAKELAQATDTRFFDGQNRASYVHDSATRITGVIVPKKDLEVVASIMRDNPKKFQL